MKQAIYTVAVGTCGLICTLGAKANSMLAEGKIDDSTLVPAGIVVVAILAVAGGSYRLAMWVAKEAEHSRHQDERIAELETLIKQKQNKQ